MLSQALAYALAHQGELANAFQQHLLLVGSALGIGILVCVPLGIITSRSKAASFMIINSFNAFRVVPSLAILFLSIPIFGLSITSVVIALTVLALPPILINTNAAFRSIDPSIREAAAGMGMTTWQSLRKVELPLAVPVILAGVRIAAVEVIASATLAAFIGAGGLGIYITRGFALYNPAILLVGAVPVAVLSIVAEFLLARLQVTLQPPTVPAQ
jgi:osmoprotectant transport system permease protein